MKIGHLILRINLLCLAGGLLCAQDLLINSISPQPNQINVNRSSNIAVNFSETIAGASIDDQSLVVQGSQSGRLSGTWSGAGSNTLTFDPDNDFRPGETVSLTLTTLLSGSGNQHLTRGHTYSFTAASGLSAATTPVLAQRNVNAATASSRDVRAMDFDGDGDLDLIAAYEGSSEQTYVYENDGNQTFCTVLPTGQFRNVQMFDLDGDGDLDQFGATGAFDTEVNWFENTGAFPFTERFISSEDPWTLAGGDLDSDGDTDLLAAVILPNRLLYFANDGLGNFSPALSIPTSYGGGSDSYFYVRDIDSDGAMDILAFHRDDFNLVWYHNNGNQVFSETLIEHTADRMRLASGDLDGDGDVDIVGASTENVPTNHLTWYENDGSQNFTPHPITVSAVGRLYNVGICDLDGDADADIVAGGYWYENGGSQNFSEHPVGAGLGTGNGLFSNGLDIADLDEDGDLDVITVGLFALAWHENINPMSVTSTVPADGALQVARDAGITVNFDLPVAATSLSAETFAVYSDLRGFLSGTLSGGGTNSITFAPDQNFLPGEVVEVSLSAGLTGVQGQQLSLSRGFTFTTASAPVAQVSFSPHSIITHSNNVSGLDAADIDGDGDIDLLTSSWSELIWHENDGAGNFTSFPVAVTGTPVNANIFDQNGDGFADFWVDNDGSAASTVYLNDGSQNFTEVAVASNLRVRQVSDINRDGQLDLLFTTYFNNWVGWFSGQCEGYVSPGNVPRLDNKDARAADMDGDGDVDFISATSLGPVFYRNNSQQTFTQESFGTSNTTSVFLADLDGDGDPDPLFVQSFSSVIWHENRLNGDSLDFGPRREVGVLSMDPRDVIAVDIDGDGDPDVAAVSRNDDPVVWFENRLNEPSADFGPEQLGVTSADGPVMLAAADLDGDGDMDLITISEGDDELMWFENNGIPNAIGEDPRPAPLSFRLDQNFPNPFNPSTTISYVLPKAAPVSLIIYNSRGQEVRRLVEEPRQAGGQETIWDGRDQAGNRVASGMYWYRLKAGHHVQTRQMLLIK